MPWNVWATSMDWATAGRGAARGRAADNARAVERSRTRMAGRRGVRFIVNLLASCWSGAETVRMPPAQAWGNQTDTPQLADVESSIYTAPYRYQLVYIACPAVGDGAGPEWRSMSDNQPLKTTWFHILLSLADHAMHGTAIMEEVMERTGGAVRLWPGTLYGSLREMADRGFITEVDPPEGAPTEGGTRRFYGLTPAGGSVLGEEVERMAAFVRVARARGVGDPRTA
jgi:DNA-binding PadR family transcriptional regulator